MHRAERGVADEHGGVRLHQHLRQVGRATEVLGLRVVPLGEQHLGEQYAGPRGRAQRDRATVQLGERARGDQVDRLDRAVATDREVGQ
jgi:hypothetical protein